MVWNGELVNIYRKDGHSRSNRSTEFRLRRFKMRRQSNPMIIGAVWSRNLDFHLRSFSIWECWAIKLKCDCWKRERGSLTETKTTKPVLESRFESEGRSRRSTPQKSVPVGDGFAVGAVRPVNAHLNGWDEKWNGLECYQTISVEQSDR
ncbi:hypothetical protein AVEN_135009-1 [Araneus ventricosus]|uniref:Uncharacterized protein n=1 Tax=Araneus ventricosus TaxID=182803 RepID=A0A4Y2G465_ARAVE|nr:hypothetical protein AVEN_135009-1 [Araneus ventricosus]